MSLLHAWVMSSLIMFNAQQCCCASLRQARQDTAKLIHFTDRKLLETRCLSSKIPTWHDARAGTVGFHWWDLRERHAGLHSRLLMDGFLQPHGVRVKETPKIGHGSELQAAECDEQAKVPAAIDDKAPHYSVYTPVSQNGLTKPLLSSCISHRTSSVLVACLAKAWVAMR